MASDPERQVTGDGNTWIRGEPGELASENRGILELIEQQIRDDQRESALESVAGWHPTDLMELLLNLPLKFARRLYDWMPSEVASEVLVEVNEDLRAALVQDADIGRITEITERLDDDDAVELLDDLPDDIAEPVLERLTSAEEIRERLEYEEDTAGEVMTNKFVVVLDDWNVGMATRAIRRKAREIETFYEVYVVDEERRLVGRLQIRDLLLNKKKVRIRDIMRDVPVVVQPDTDQEDLLELARIYKVGTIPVVDDERQVIGRITVEELQEIQRDEAEEDIMLMSGLAPDALPDDTVGRIIKGRLPWLAGGLFGAVLAGAVVGSFEEQLRQAAILASFIPVVMAMAGNAGIQASTVTVQGLAAGNLWIGDLGRRVTKEFIGSLINGAIIATTLGALVLIISGLIDIPSPLQLAIAAGVSVLLVTIIAATLGSTVPLVLNHFGIDPAVATGVFITTTNDILGVLVYFTVASTIYLGSVA